jgi:glycosyltransferase involved in cell wall biosynthesis
MADTFGFLSTYPPTQCGLATFTAALSAELHSPAEVRVPNVVRCVDQPTVDSPPEVMHHLVSGSRASQRAAAAALNRFDVAIVQHEFGIFGGRDGEEVLAVLRDLTVPAIVVLHTVLVNPSAHQRQVLEDALDVADAVVVMTLTAHRRLIEGYSIDPSKVSIIPHGAPVNTRRSPRRAPGVRPVVLTWGLLGPGKGIEWAVEAMAGLKHLEPSPRYLVVGQTHPRVRERDGEAYRDGLTAQAEALGIAESVEFHGDYLDLKALGDIVAAADIVLLPYDSRDQVTSGVLIEAIAAGKPVVATSFPHAVELLSSGAGLLVPHASPAAMTSALERLLTDDAFAVATAAHAERLAPELGWPAVAGRYLEIAEELAKVSSASAVA